MLEIVGIKSCFLSEYAFKFDVCSSALMFCNTFFLFSSFYFIGSLEKFRQGTSNCSHWSCLHSCPSCSWWPDSQGWIILLDENDKFFYCFSLNKVCLFVFLWVLNFSGFIIWCRRTGRNFLKPNFSTLRWKYILSTIYAWFFAVSW